MSEFLAWAWQPEWLVGAATVAVGIGMFALLEVLVDWRAARRRHRRDAK